VIEVPRRQSTGPFAPRDVVAEIEDVVEVVFEGETEDSVGPGLESESEAAGAHRSRGIPDRSILRFISMAAPKFSAAPFTNRGAKIASGPSRKKINETNPLIPHAREKISFTLLSLCRMHECFHSRIERKRFVKPAPLKELLRISDFWNREFAVVLVLKFLLASTRFVWMSTRLT
jgi:hypothetical protein